MNHKNYLALTSLLLNASRHSEAQRQAESFRDIAQAVCKVYGHTRMEISGTDTHNGIVQYECGDCGQKYQEPMPIHMYQAIQRMRQREFKKNE